MKRLILHTILSVMLAAQPLAAHAIAGGPTLTAQASKTSVAVNETFTVSVQLNTKTYEVSAVDLKLSFPSVSLQAVSVQAGAFMTSVLTPGATGSGTATITLGSGVTPVTGTGTIATVTFKALAAGTPQVAFSSDTQIAAKNQAGNVVDSMTPVTITVGGVQATTTATVKAGAPLGAAGKVSTGPFESSVMALIVSAIVTLLYVGYTATDTFRRREAEGIAHKEQDKAPDFKEE